MLAWIGGRIGNNTCGDVRDTVLDVSRYIVHHFFRKVIAQIPEQRLNLSRS